MEHQFQHVAMLVFTITLHTEAHAAPCMKGGPVYGMHKQQVYLPSLSPESIHIVA